MFNDRIANVLREKGGELAHGYTYSGHPVCCGGGAGKHPHPAGREHRRHLQSTTPAPIWQQRWKQLGEHPLVGEARIAGMVGALELVPNKAERKFFAERGKVGVCAVTSH